MILLERFLSFTSITLKRFIFTATMIVSTITFVSVIGIMSWIMLRQAQEDSERASVAIARQIRASMIQAMERGLSRTEMENILRGFRQQVSGEFSITLHPAAPQGTENDPDIAAVFAQGEPLHQRSFPVFQHLLPLKAEAGCIACHPGVKPGDVLGVLEIKEDITEVSDAMVYRAFLCFNLLLPIPLLMASLVSRFVNRHLGEAIARLNNKVQSVTRISDLTKVGMELEAESETLKFGELEEIYGGFGTFVQRIKDMAVGKEMLEFEIKVLERFIITGDSIRDWKERVSYLLEEINKVMPAYALFCIFQIEEEIYDIEVFWAAPPSPATRQVMEEIIHQQAERENLRSHDGVSIQLTHNIANEKRAPLELTVQEIELETKSLYLERPQIGGVVGIGVQSQIMKDPIRSLVINSILTTLLNVVGSIKAIYKYTKDLEYYATRDPLTNLYNQRVFWELLGYEIGRAERHNYHFGVLVIDLDNFKHINDTYGHLVGDKYLAKIAETIHDCLRTGDILSRYGGDEFALVLPEADQEQVFMVADRIREAMAGMTLVSPDGAKIRATGSIGFAIYPTHALKAKDLFLFADNMTYKAKGLGKNCIAIPTNDDVVEVFQKSNEMSRVLLQALEERQVIPFFQPIVTTDTREIVCHEVLCRLVVEGRITPAAEFIEVAERLGVVSRLDGILMEKVFEKAHAAGYEGYLFINLSPKSLILKDFVPSIIRLTHQYRIRHDRVVFEITERETVKNMTLLENFVQDLKLEGFKFAIDDFGSGFSSFQYIRRLPIDFVKIEGIFVRNMLSDAKDMAFVKTLAVLAHEFGIQTIAEYVETEEVLNAIRDLGIDLAQGYHTGRPGPDLLLTGRKE
ncbi:bifunctional diguanylate cyclase/phosphodiesterase [Geobacter sp. SVR]|uniref:putative bifunctional diguanylate cyclase/phosphodiesterase n=1 Tax=Geobacter sp. SVR TaxID=2495594 RepID=UPI00143F0526|nr:GGDEF domain-containing phosphodiesterase [Geobacter sp. SVR]BCS54380.1 GGDEF-domain containing protein [Geobacter sp. SVR]GCF87451.1 GGDEF-domain containing protein [Geobacter sp. SVR]